MVAALGFASHRIGVGPTLALSIAAQMAAALLIDSVGGPQSPSVQALFGGVLLVVGAVFVATA